MESDDSFWLEKVDVTHTVRQAFPAAFEASCESKNFENPETRELPLLKRSLFLIAPHVSKMKKTLRKRVPQPSEIIDELECEMKKVAEADRIFPERILIAEPKSVEFHNFRLGKKYNRIVRIRNVSTNVARYQLAKRSDARKLKLILQVNRGSREDLAPGMLAILILLFTAKTPENYTENVVINVEHGRPVIINVSAFRDPPILIAEDTFSQVYISSANLINTEDNLLLSCLDRPSSPKRGSLTYLLDEGELECNKCLVGEEKFIETRLINLGSSGYFFIISEENWHSKKVANITEGNQLVLSCFTLFPAYFHLKENQSLILKTYFTPNTQGFHVEKLYLICDNFSVQSMEVLGDGIMFNCELIHFESNFMIENVCPPETEVHKFCTLFNLELDTVTHSADVTVSNLSEFHMHFRWEIVNEICLSVVPQSGVFPAFTALVFRISSTNRYLCRQFVESDLQLFLENLPRLCIPEEYNDFTAECKNPTWNNECSVDICVANVSVRLPSTSSSIISDDTFSSEGM